MGCTISTPEDWHIPHSEDDVFYGAPLCHAGYEEFAVLVRSQEPAPRVDLVEFPHKDHKPQAKFRLKPAGERCYYLKPQGGRPIVKIHEDTHQAPDQHRVGISKYVGSARMMTLMKRLATVAVSEHWWGLTKKGHVCTLTRCGEVVGVLVAKPGMTWGLRVKAAQTPARKAATMAALVALHPMTPIFCARQKPSNGTLSDSAASKCHDNARRWCIPSRTVTFNGFDFCDEDMGDDEATAATGRVKERLEVFAAKEDMQPVCTEAPLLLGSRACVPILKVQI